MRKQKSDTQMVDQVFMPKKNMLNIIDSLKEIEKDMKELG